MEPSRFYACRQNNQLNATWRLRKEGEITAGEYIAEERTAAIEVFKEGMLGGMKREEGVALYERM